MIVFKVKSLDKETSDIQLEHQGVKTTSFLSFERAIEETLGSKNAMEDVKGYRVTDQGIEIIWK